VKRIFVLFFTYIAAVQSHGLNQEFAAGGTHGWDSIARSVNTELVSGRGGYPEIALRGSEYKPDNDTDLLIHFNGGIFDETGSYSVEINSIGTTGRYRVLGSGSGVFRKDKRSLVLVPGKGSVFSPGSSTSSFTIEFWLDPLRFDDGEEVISFKTSMMDGDGNIIPQSFSGFFEDRKIIWSFTNFFFNPETYSSKVTVSGYTPLIPGQWHHHMITFDGRSGLMEYFVDDKLEGVSYATVSGSDDGEPLIPVIGTIAPGKLNIGNRYYGFMDELRILTRVNRNPVLSRYQNGYGQVETVLVDMGRKDSVLDRINIDDYVPGDSCIQYYYRIYSDYGDSVNGGKEWIPFSPGSYLKDNNKGRYFEIRMDLFAGVNGTVSPRVHSVSADYSENLPPLAPAFLSAEKGDGEITLSWDDINEPDIEGYLIYYGTKPGVYLGDGSTGIPSPIIVKDITSYTVKGLKNGRLYYFAVAAYDSAGVEYPGDLSYQVSARPGPVPSEGD